MPEYLGTADSIATSMRDGKLFAGAGDAAQECILSTAAELAALGCDLPEGLHAVGTGSTGAGDFHLPTMLGRGVL